MPHTLLTRRQGGLLVKMIIIGMIVQLSVVGFVAYSSFKDRGDLVHAQRRACERGKLDRTDNADFQVAHKKYIDKVVLAQSVKEDVKKAARDAVKIYNRTSADLAKRARIRCAEAFPKGGVVP